MGYQVGVTPLQMAAAVSSRRQRRRVRRAARRSRDLPRQPPLRSQAERGSPHHRRGHGGDAHRDHGGRRRARHRHKPRRCPASRSRERPARPPSSSTATTRSRDYNASFVGFLPSRDPAITIIVVIDSPRTDRTATTAAACLAPIFKRIAEASLRYLGVGPTLNPAPPVLVAATRRIPAVANHDSSPASARREEPPAISRRARRPARHDAGPARHERARGASQAGQARPDGSR